MRLFEVDDDFRTGFATFPIGDNVRWDFVSRTVEIVGGSYVGIMLMIST
jgi:hypothetical protein